MGSKPSSDVLDFSGLYALGIAFKKGALHFDVVTGDWDLKQLLEGQLQLPRPLELRRDSGTKPQDLMGATDVAILLVSEKFIDTLLDERVTGWGTYDVRLFDSAGIELPGYHGLSIHGRAGAIDRTRARIVIDPPATEHGRPTYVARGLYFDPTTWDGSDMFLPQGTSVVCVTDGVKRVIARRKLTNIFFTRLTDFPGMRYSTFPEGRHPAS